MLVVVAVVVAMVLPRGAGASTNGLSGAINPIHGWRDLQRQR
jgi:hypothetical protein